MEKPRNTMPSQFPAFRLMVARQMEGYRERIARRIRQEASKHGESAPDLAHALSVYPSTAERWFRGERTPQRRHRKQLAEHWGLELSALEPDLAAEERALIEQLTRIEEKLADIEKKLDDLSPAGGLDEKQVEDAAARLPDPTRQPPGEGADGQAGTG